MLNTVSWEKRTLETWVRELLVQKGCADVEVAMFEIKAVQPDTDWNRHEASCAAVTKALLLFDVDRCLQSRV